MNFRTLDLNLLRVFDAVMAEGSLTRAAERLAMTQPAASHALKRLHQAVGEDLLHRTAFGMRPTARAEALWPQVRAALAQLQTALSPRSFDPAADAATFSIAMADATAAMLLPALVVAIENADALANLRVLPLTTRDPRRMVEEGDADLAVGYFPTAIAAIVAQGADAVLHHARLYASEYVCVMRRDHPLAARELTLDAFVEARHLLVSFSGRAHGFVDEALAALGRRRRVMLTVNQFATAGSVVARSDLLTVLPRQFLPATGVEHRLAQKPLPMPVAPIHVEMMWHLRKDDDPAHRWLRDRVMDAAVGKPAVRR
ncbi:MAG TPA: LysR family transcriptional regulator [Burkholderiaceae bacterium]